MIISKSELQKIIEVSKNEYNIDNNWRLYSDCKNYIYDNYGWFENPNDYDKTIENLTDLLGI